MPTTSAEAQAPRSRISRRSVSALDKGEEPEQPGDEAGGRSRLVAVTNCPQKITFGEMRDMGVRGILIYCADYKCSHSIAISGEEWPDELRAH